VPYAIFEFQKDHIVEICTNKAAKETGALDVASRKPTEPG
jgi:hypothetical protein